MRDNSGADRKVLAAGRDSCQVAQYNLSMEVTTAYCIIMRTAALAFIIIVTTVYKKYNR